MKICETFVFFRWFFFSFVIVVVIVVILLLLLQFCFDCRFVGVFCFVLLYFDIPVKQFKGSLKM